MTLTFTHAGPGRVVCHGTPPLSVRVGTTDYPCADPTAEWCEVTPNWTVGTHTVACVNFDGASPATVVEVPEVGLVPGLLVGLAFTAVWAWVIKGAR